MKNILLYLLTVGLFIFAACSKNQTRTDVIHGKWKITQWDMRSDGELIQSMSSAGRFEFESCSLRRNDFCSYTHQLSDQNKNVSGEYRFENRGKQLVLHERGSDGSVRVITYNVIDVSCDVLRIETTDSLHHALTLVRT